MIVPIMTARMSCRIRRRPTFCVLIKVSVEDGFWGPELSDEGRLADPGGPEQYDPVKRRRTGGVPGTGRAGVTRGTVIPQFAVHTAPGPQTARAAGPERVPAIHDALGCDCKVPHPSPVVLVTLVLLDIKALGTFQRVTPAQVEASEVLAAVTGVLGLAVFACPPWPFERRTAAVWCTATAGRVLGFIGAAITGGLGITTVQQVTDARPDLAVFALALDAGAASRCAGLRAGTTAMTTI